jgi:transcriptional regulator with XRE-family HTH domain
MEYLADIGETLRGRREAAGLTQAQLAALSGVSQPTISAIESGKDTSTATLRKLGDALARVEAGATP